jgi:hypothetical protein
MSPYNRTVRLIAALLTSMAVWGQTEPRKTPEKPPDRAAAYFHFTLAHMYAEMAATSFGGNREYLEKAVENHRMAVAADPSVPPLRFRNGRAFAPVAPKPRTEEIPAPERK